MVMERMHRSRYTGMNVMAKEAFSAAQIMAVVVGILFIAVGVLGLWRTGFHSTTTPIVAVGRLTVTPIVAVAHIGVGVLAMIGASNPGFARGIMTIIGFGLVALGVAILIQPPPSLGFQRDNGFAYLLIGVLATGSSVMTPTISAKEEVGTP